MEFERVKPTMTLIRLMERWDFQVYYMIASDEEIRSTSFLDKTRKPVLEMAGWRFADVTERDVFRNIGVDTETVVDGWANEWKTEFDFFED
jgi:hypothetical protein